MRHRYAYAGPEGGAFEVPDARLCAAPPAPPPPDEEALLRDALAPLADLARGKRRVLLLVDDATRKTPVARILPHVARGLAERDVTVLTAQGTHRRMTQEELDAKLGTRRWPVRQHDWRDEARLERIGTTSGGMPVVVNRLLGESDLVVGIGGVGVHGIMGYSGGAKIVIPGVAGAASESWTHWRATDYAQEDLMGVVENPIRREIEEGARMAGLDAVLNVAMDAEGRVQHASFGNLVEAQRECARVAGLLHAVDVGEPADVVVTDSAPADRDFWQSVKGLYAGTIAVREGGVIVLASPNPEGVADNHPDLVRLAGLPLDEIRARVAAGQVEDVIAAAVGAYVARIRERSDVHVVSGGIADDAARAMGLVPFGSMQEAVDAAVQKAGGDVAVLDGGGHLLPVVRGRNDRRALTRSEAA